MSINLNALKKKDEEIKSRGGSDLYFSGRSVNEEGTFIRIVPPLPEQEGIYFLETTIYWIGNRKIICPSTFGLPSVIEEYLEEIKSLIDDGKKDLEKLYNEVNKKTEFTFPAFVFSKMEFDKEGEIESYEILDGKAKIFQAGPMQLKQINNVVLSPKINRKLAKKNADISDRKYGFNILLTKTGKNLETEYFAEADEQMAIDAKYYKTIPSIIIDAKSQVYNDDYLYDLLDHYFYGEQKPNDEDKVSVFEDEVKAYKESMKSSKEEDKEESGEEEEEEKSKRRRKKEEKEEEKPRRRRRSKAKEEEPEEEEEKPQRRRRRTKTEDDSSKEKPKSNLLDKIEDLDDDD